MNTLEFVIPLRHASDAATFNSIGGLDTKAGKPKRKRLTGDQLATTVVISLIASATYDGLKAAAFQVVTETRKYFRANDTGMKNAAVNFNGIPYSVETEADQERLMHDVEAAIKSSLKSGD